MSPFALGLLAALATSVCWGVCDFASGEMAKKNKTLAFTSSLYIVELPPLIFLTIISGKYGSWSSNLTLFLLGSLGTAGFLLLVYALAHGHVSVVISLTGLLTLIVPAIFSIIIGESSSALTWIGLIVACVAIVCISQVTEPEAHEDKEQHHKALKISLLIGVISGLSIGMYLIGLGHVESPMLMKLVLVQLPGLIFALGYFARRWTDTLVLRKNFWIIALICVGYQIPQFLFVYAVDKTSLVITNVISNLYPGITILLAWFFVGHKTSRIQNIGFVFAVIGIVTVSVGVGN